MNVKDLLKGCKAGKPQSVGIMTVIPIVTNKQNNNFVSPNNEGVKFKTSGYGVMEFDNETTNEVLIPPHTGFIVKKAAQNHAMSKAGYIKANSRKRYDDAQCIQQSQGGYIPSGNYEMTMLPAKLRETSLKTRGKNDFGKLWPSITKFNSLYNVDKSGHLEAFYEKFDKDLDEFVAQFEPVDNQVGAIILVCGEIVGVERYPSTKYFKSIWNALVRDCYGSLAFEQILKGVKPEDAVYKRLDTKGAKSLSDIRKGLENADASVKQSIKSIIDALIDQDFKTESDSDNIRTLENDQLFGQCMLQRNEVTFASLTVRSNWSKKAKRQKKAASDFEVEL